MHRVIMYLRLSKYKLMSFQSNKQYFFKIIASFWGVFCDFLIK